MDCFVPDVSKNYTSHHRILLSHPIWVCGSKRQKERGNCLKESGRTLHRCVDRNNGELGHTMSHPHRYVDRNTNRVKQTSTRSSRILRGCVDRNSVNFRPWSGGPMSVPLWVRGSNSKPFSNLESGFLFSQKNILAIFHHIRKYACIYRQII